MTLARRLAAEGIGTAFLLAVIVGSGITGEHLAAGNAAVALLANSLATGCGLWVLIEILGPISGAHLNPAVTIALAATGAFSWRDVLPYVSIQMLCAFVGVAAAHLMFGMPPFTASLHARSGVGQLLGEAIATAGLILIIWLGSRQKVRVSALVAAYITAAYWFTSSTSFANPAVTFARAATDTFAGIRPSNVPGFVIVELLSAVATMVLARWFLRSSEGCTRVP